MSKMQIDKLVSSFNMSDASRIKGLVVWAAKAPEITKNPDTLYVKCVVLSGSTDKVLRVRQIEPPCDEEFTITKSEALNCNTNIDPVTYGDIGLIPHTNPACVLDFLRTRYLKKYIYTTVDPLLVAVNPFTDLKNTTDENICQYRDAPNIDAMPPHVFVKARIALENMHTLEKPQSLIVSGESGAGKTEATKHIMRFFAAVKSGGLNDTRIQQAVLAANPFLEAFGNAKTIRNNNSSRFGRFMQLDVAASGGIRYAKIQNFLLEKSRIVTQSPEERNYHIFYQLIKSADSKMKSKFHLKALKDYEFINSACLDVPNMDDVEEFDLVMKFFRSINLSDSTIDMIISLLSGILTLGNVKIEGSDAAEIGNPQELKLACELLHLNFDSVKEHIIHKISYVGGETIRGNWNQVDANVLRLSLAKAVYERLFFHIVTLLNKTIEPQHDFQLFIGMLDIFGFEIFKQNSLEQLFINITNELIQQSFINTVFEKETKLYQQEGINFSGLVWTTNIDIINILIRSKPCLMSLLEDQCLVAGCNDEKFLSTVNENLKNSTIITKAKVRPNINFIIKHTIGPIQYSCENFITKNKDILRPEFVELFQKSENELNKLLFEGVVVEKGKLAKGQLIGSQFLKQLESLIGIINSTEPHYIRCVKPNEEKMPLVFNNAKVLIQLRALSILEALNLRNFGYSYRRPFVDFVKQFKYVNGQAVKKLNEDPKLAASMILESAKIHSNGYRVGKTMLFLTNTALKELERYQREAISHFIPLIEVLEPMILRKMRLLTVEKNTPGLIRFQAHVRRVLASVK